MDIVLENSLQSNVSYNAEINNTSLIPQENVTIPTIIYPPPDIKSIVDKTAEYVSQSGPVLEQRVRETESNNPKFSFLNPNDPYNSYYLHQLEQCRLQKINPVPTPIPAPVVDTNPEYMNFTNEIIPIEPDPFNFIASAPTISAQDLDVMKSTAQFAVKNGRQFIVSLMQREQRNSQFDFLRPNHRLFPYFNTLIDQYSKIIHQNHYQALINTLYLNVEDRNAIISRIEQREKFASYYENERKMHELASNKESEAYYSVDWHDFVVVGTLEILETDISADLPGPIRLSNLQSMSLVEKAADTKNQMYPTIGNINGTNSSLSNQVTQNRSTEENIGYLSSDQSDVEMEDEDEEENTNEVNQTKPTPPTVVQPARSTTIITHPPNANKNPSIKLRTDYTSRLLPAKTPAGTWSCPVCSQLVPVAEIEEHIRIEMLDPKRKEQREVYESKIRDSNLVQADSEIAKNLKKFALKRMDMLGESDTPKDENSLESNDSRRVPIIWDGHAASAEETAKRASAGFSTEEQIAAIHRRKGFITDSNSGRIGPQVLPNAYPNIAMNPLQPFNNIPVSGYYPSPNSLSSGFVPNPQPPMGYVPQSMNSVPETQSSSTVQYNIDQIIAESINKLPQDVTQAPKRDIGEVNNNVTNDSITAPVDTNEQVQEYKKLKTEDFDESYYNQYGASEASQVRTGLLYEKEWIELFPDPFSISVEVSNVLGELPKKDIQDPIILIDNVSTSMTTTELKALITNATGLPSSKQKLTISCMYDENVYTLPNYSSVGLVMKNTATIASYNLATGASLTLGLRERGGRR
ncbi:hypothetical protein BB558_005567 [Smittium angustum]|uniref:SURP motif domain-containing protein n=1 Tax=Smittium angustum TaxID=133377 RepID=A0A2U1J039_SMIAN|nr:hypothetical protein BB558_005567 [Smittium angustum]